MWVEVTRPCGINGEAKVAGDVIELPRQAARLLIASGKAKETARPERRRKRGAPKAAELARDPAPADPAEVD